MVGVVLCGGDSTRMGNDKGLLQEAGIAWANLAAEKLALLNMPVVISVNSSQAPYYQFIFPSTPVITDQPALQLRGPLAGLLSVHIEHPGEDLFILACDMPRMTISVLQVLYDLHLRTNDAHALLFMNNGQAEPLCAIYSARALAKITSMYQQHLLKKHSMKCMLEQMEPVYITATEDQVPCFTNMNSPCDLNSHAPPGAAA